VDRIEPSHTRPHVTGCPITSERQETLKTTPTAAVDSPSFADRRRIDGDRWRQSLSGYGIEGDGRGGGTGRP
jgi:hypothetical protein